MSSVRYPGPPAECLYCEDFTPCPCGGCGFGICTAEGEHTPENGGNEDCITWNAAKCAEHEEEWWAGYGDYLYDLKRDEEMGL